MYGSSYGRPGCRSLPARKRSNTAAAASRTRRRTRPRTAGTSPFDASPAQRGASGPAPRTGAHRNRTAACRSPARSTRRTNRTSPGSSPVGERNSHWRGVVWVSLVSTIPPPLGATVRGEPRAAAQTLAAAANHRVSHLAGVQHVDSGTALRTSHREKSMGRRRRIETHGAW